MKAENQRPKGLVHPSSFILHPSESDLRGFEWYYYQHLLESSAAVFSGHGDSVVDAAFTTDGPLVTLDQNGQLRRWDLGSQHEDQASRRDLPGGPAAQVRVLSPNGRLAALAEGNKVRVFDTSTGHETFAVDSANRTYSAVRLDLLTGRRQVGHRRRQDPVVERRERRGDRIS